MRRDRARALVTRGHAVALFYRINYLEKVRFWLAWRILAGLSGVGTVWDVMFLM